MSEEAPVYSYEEYLRVAKKMGAKDRRLYKQFLVSKGVEFPETTGRDEEGRFVKGEYTGGPGRPVGYKLRLASKVYQTIYEAFEAKGKDIVDRAMAGEDVKDAIAFMKMLSSMLPKTVELESSTSSQQLLDYIANQSTSSPMAKLKPEADEPE